MNVGASDDRGVQASTPPRLGSRAFTSRSATFIGSVQFAARVTERLAAFGLVVLIAYVFGTDARADLYFIASIGPLIIGTILGETLAVLILPALVRRHGRPDLIRFVASGFWVAATMLLVVLVLYAAVAVAVVREAAPAGSADTAPWLLFAPTLVALGLSSFLGGVLLSYERYVWPPFRTAAASIAVLVFCALALKLTDSLNWLAFASTAGYMLSLALLMLELRRVAGWGYLGTPTRAALTEVLKLRRRLTAPLVSGLVGGQAFVLLERLLAAPLGVGAVSTISYARGLVFTPNMLGQAVAGGIYPGMVRAHEANARTFVRDSFLRGLRLTLFFSIPLVVYFALYSTSIATVLFERGAFSAQSVDAVSETVVAFSVAILGSMLLILTSRVFYAVDWFIANVWSQLTVLLFYLPLAFAFRATIGISGLALAFGVAETLGGMASAVLAGRRLGIGRPQIAPVAVAAAQAGIVVAGLAAYRLAFALSAELAGQELLMAAGGAIVLLAGTSGVLWVFKWPEAQPLQRAAGRAAGRARDIAVRLPRRWPAIAAGVSMSAILVWLVPATAIALLGAGLVVATIWRPGWLLAVSITGPFLYLVALDLAGIAPRTRTTGAYYGAVGVLLVWVAWRHRTILLERVRRRTSLFSVWLVTGALLGSWLIVNIALLSDGSLSRRILGLFVFATVPTTICVLAVRPETLRQLAAGLVGVGLLYAVTVVLTLPAGLTEDEVRFSPVDELNPISAATVPALGALALLAFRARGISWVAQLAGFFILVASFVVSGSRGALLAFLVAIVLVFLAQPRSRVVILVPVCGLALLLGGLVGESVGAVDSYLAGAETVANPGSVQAADLSSLQIRRQWMADALRAIPEKPVLGHGIGSLVDNTPEAVIMGVQGQRIYPHNDLIEAMYSLGVIGLITFVLLTVIPIAQLVGVRSRLGTLYGTLALGVFGFAFVLSNTSGEIGEDVMLWAGAALVGTLWLDLRANVQEAASSLPPA